MATTGFWPVKGSLKKVLDYADNPDKTTGKKYLDDDLAQVLRYAQNAEKTDQRMYHIILTISPSKHRMGMTAPFIPQGWKQCRSE